METTSTLTGQTATKCVIGFVLREQLMTLIVGTHAYTAEHAGQAVHTVLGSKCVKATVWLLWLLTLPDPGVTKTTRAIHRNLPLEAAIRQLGTALTVAINRKQQLKS
jgi:hypothetical protein